MSARSEAKTTFLTPREREVLALLRVRSTNAEIAAQLNVSVRTAEHHVSRILAKLEAANRREAGQYHLVAPEPSTHTDTL